MQRIADKIEAATNCRWRILAALVLASAAWPVLAAIEIAAIALATWYHAGNGARG